MYFSQLKNICLCYLRKLTQILLYNAAHVQYIHIRIYIAQDHNAVPAIFCGLYAGPWAKGAQLRSPVNIIDFAVLHKLSSVTKI